LPPAASPASPCKPAHTLHRITQFTGRYSLLDILVVAITIVVVNFGDVAPCRSAYRAPTSSPPPSSSPCSPVFVLISLPLPVRWERAGVRVFTRRARHDRRHTFNSATSAPSRHRHRKLPHPARPFPPLPLSSARPRLRLRPGRRPDSRLRDARARRPRHGQRHPHHRQGRYRYAESSKRSSTCPIIIWS